MKKRPINLKFFVNEGQQRAKPCGHADCQSQGLYKAPKDYRLQDYVWLCLEHVRAHNAAWNYGGAMNYDEIGKVRQDALSWDRPTRPMTGRFEMDDPFDLFAQDPSYKPMQATCGDTRAALSVLGFERPVNVHSLKDRYRNLVKEHHPDVNGGCKHSEERLKQINEAYRFLNDKLSSAA